MSALYDFLRKMKISYNYPPFKKQMQTEIEEAIKEYNNLYLENENLEIENARLQKAVEEARKVIEHIVTYEEQDMGDSWNIQLAYDWLAANPKERE